MALRIIQILPPKTLSQSQKPQLYPSTIATHLSKRPKTQIKSTNNKIDDADLASDLATEVAKMNTHLAQKEEAMKKSKQLLFGELCEYLGMEKEELKRKWSKMEQEDKWVLVKGFVNEWGENFQPLSARSVKDMVDEYLNGEDSDKPSSSVLKKFIGFSQNE